MDTRDMVRGGLCFCIGSVLLLFAACTPVRAPVGGPPASGPPTGAPPPIATLDRWQEIREWMPYPYTTPLPRAETTALDGVYVRFDPRQDQRPPCRRCPPYPPEGGIWKVQFDQGVFRVYHSASGWRTLGSFAVEGRRVTLFNDPQCHLAAGEFAWRRDEEGLHFRLIADDCELGTRARNFTQQTWQSCQPPNHEAAVTGHWKTPAGCDP